MKICFITEHFYPHIGGVEAVFFEFAKRLSAEGNEVRVITSHSGGIIGEKYENGFSAFYYKCFSLFTHPILSKKYLEKHIKWADIVHTTTLTACLPAVKVCQNYKKPCVLMVPEIIGNRWFKIEKNPLKALAFLLFERFAIKKKYTFYQAISEATKKDMLKAGIPENKIELIYPGIDYSIWNKDIHQMDINKFFEFRGNSKIFLYSGRPGKTKGIFILLNAIISLKDKLPKDFKFGLILGKEPKKERKKLEDSIKKYKLGELARIKNPVSASELAKIKKSSFAVIIPSLTEGFGISAAETSALDIPIISSNAGSLREVISQKALFFENGNSRDLAQKIILAAENKFNYIPRRKFDWENSIKKLAGLYEKLLKI
jgi:glycosyltransferase involved in cell wall biosynthesis